MRSRALAALGLILALTGCGDDRPPPVQVRIEILAPGIYRMDGQDRDDRSLERELRRLADEDRNAITGNARPMVTILGDTDLVNGLAERCIAMGINRIQTVR